MSTIDDLQNMASRIKIMTALAPILDELGQTMVKTIRTRVRLGYGLSADGKVKEKFAPLMPSTIIKRKKMMAAGLLFNGAKPARSHLTMTGDMMDQLIYDVEPGQLTILFATSFADDKARWAHEGSRNRAQRPFMFLTDLEIKEANRIIQKGLDAYIDEVAQNL